MEFFMSGLMFYRKLKWSVWSIQPILYEISLQISELKIKFSTNIYFFEDSQCQISEHVGFGKKTGLRGVRTTKTTV